MNSQLAWGTPGTADSPLWFALPRSFVLVPLFYLRYGIFFRWHGYGPYRCNVVGVCAPLPGPNELGFIATWPGVFVDVFVLTFVMVLAECKLALSWRLWRAQLSRESNAGVLPGGARRASD
ncbi:uncharacterized protein MICPUCDRAFT_58678 [Micromonas pusilla CCMP1545]|uniref:Predicted protein n=2 Tax=Micromonas pusilla TaxID=38833 RepID=C1MU60_MICPC|nr:uncharacterized protein MICPUCDRAFT_58678 [Micromonas pusilla CCMP1545]EEH56273.1 predicted protein [Micromonas pusilla CCMP1545]|eukprot:XP_003059141.1 predicted protein [Micromonas pusilla CCMP1545]